MRQQDMLADTKSGPGEPVINLTIHLIVSSTSTANEYASTWGPFY